MLTLYDYQTDIINRTRQAMGNGHKHIMVQSPTGSGKTVMFSYIVSEMRKNNKRALIITDRIELLFETGGTLEQFNLKPFHILAGQMVQPPIQYQVYIAMSQTLRRRIGKWDKFMESFDVVIIDEAHKQEFNPYFEHDVFNGAFVLGFSATPIRSGKQRQLADDYETIVLGPQVPYLIRHKRLVPDKYFGVPHADMKGVRLNSFGDYQESSMYERFNKRELYSGVIDNWKRLTPDTATLVFCVNIQHSIETCKAFNRDGIKAKFLTSDVSYPKLGKGKSAEVRYQEQMRDYENWKEAFRNYSGDRKDIIRQWKRNDFPVLVNAGILTTGFNRKDIETVIVNRATTSVALWLQMLGRGSRTFNGMRSGGWFDKTHFNILDFGGNAQQLGYYNQERTWSLWHEKKKSEGAPPVKVCGKGDPISGVPGKPDKNGNHGCGAYLFASAKICSYCGYIFEQEAKSKHVELVKIDYSQEIDFKENPFDKLEREREARGYKQGWVINRIIAEYGDEGLKKYAKHKGYQNGWLYGTLKRYDHAIRKFQERQRVKSESE